MLFNLSRIMLWLIVSLFIFFKIRKTKIVHKKLISLLSVVLCLVIICFSAMYPIENLFINFKYPESVFNYANHGKIDDILYGKESCMVIYSDQNSSGGHYIIPKVKNWYKIPNYFITKKVSNKFDRNGSFDVYNVLGTQDYYIVGVVLSNFDEQNIIDKYNQPIKNIVIDMNDTETKTVILYSYLENYSDDYYFVINGTKITISG